MVPTVPDSFPLDMPGLQNYTSALHEVGVSQPAHQDRPSSIAMSSGIFKRHLRLVRRSFLER